MMICSLDKPTLESAIETAVTAEPLNANDKGLHGPTERAFGKRTLSRLAEEEDEAEVFSHRISRRRRRAA
jgi:hypothetical protein